MFTYMELQLEKGIGSFKALSDTTDLTPEERLPLDAMEGEVLELEGSYSLSWDAQGHYNVVVSQVVLYNGSLSIVLADHEMNMDELAYEIENKLSYSNLPELALEAQIIDNAYKNYKE